MADYDTSSFNTAAYHAYDAVWTLAYAINRYWNSNCINLYDVTTLGVVIAVTYPLFVLHICNTDPWSIAMRTSEALHTETMEGK